MNPRRQSTWTLEQASATFGTDHIIGHLQNDYTPMTSSSEWLVGTSLYGSIAVTGAAIQAHGGSLWELYRAVVVERQPKALRKRKKNRSR
jgi:hypothetical protein